MRIVPLLILVGCAKGPTRTSFDDAMCFGLAGFQTAIATAAQADGKTIPGFDLDVSECIDVTAVCDAERAAWAAYTAGAIVALEESVTTAHINIPAVEIGECPDVE